ncbi:polysaccharide deacetylase family protein [Pontibacter sp. BT731]|uniref:polysaccharide deacetylase family protein n=1 Tax=Pontibacter coccineus TaxID=3063328 RepID=UPI0026E3F28B|nr:polysaccharide deacetylase family protein [Pontibacter sp. BT731]MDO6391762.1 polysaccharide deacetylase family protein [Pontibacter sp. BT731]
MNVWWLYKLRAALKSSATILMYHRVATPITDPWQLAVSPENFEQQLQLLTKSKSVVSVPQLVEALKSHKLNKKYIALTFDDGYIDNFHVVKPLLEKYEIPATFFITTGYVGQKKEFWWDELEKILIHTNRLPPSLKLDVEGKLYFFSLGTDTLLTKDLNIRHQNWIHYESPTARCRIYLELWRLISPLKHEEQQQILASLREWAQIETKPRPEYCCMNSKQVKELASNPLFSIGAHTAFHPALACHPASVQRREIVESRLFLEKIVSKDINILAYPSGSFNEESIAILKKEQYKAALSTIPKTVTNQEDPYKLGRFQVNNWGRNKFERNLLHWSCL